MDVDDATDAQRNIACRLALLAARRPHRLALIHPTRRSSTGRLCYIRMTLDRLEGDSARLALCMAEKKVCPGDRVVVMLDLGPDLLRVVFGLFRLGAVPVVVDSERTFGELGPCLEGLEPVLFIGSPSASLRRRLARWAPQTLRGSVTALAPRWWTGPTLDALMAENTGGETQPPWSQAGSDPALILITDGGEAGPRAITQSHDGLRSVMDSLVSGCGLESGGLHLCSSPLMAILSPLMGMTSLSPSMNSLRPGCIEPAVLLELIDDLGPRFFSGSPAFLARLGAAAQAVGASLNTLEVLLSLGPPCSMETLASLVGSLRENTKILLVYSSMEYPAMAVLDGRQMPPSESSQAICLGRPIASLETGIIDSDPNGSMSDCLPWGEVGEIGIRVQEPARGSWHRTGDMGCIDAEGILWFHGRKSDRIPLAGGALDTFPCENFFNSHDQVARSALIAVGEEDPEPLVVIQSDLELSEGDQARLRDHLLTRATDRGFPIRMLLFHENIPVDLRHCARIDRRALTVWARSQG